MRQRLGAVVAILMGLLAIVAVSCGDESTSPTPRPISTASPSLEVPRAGPPALPSTPTPIPPETKQAAQAFAQGYGAVTATWEQLHADFDNWRQGLIACDASSVQDQLRLFAADGAAIAAEARNVSRAEPVRHLADRLVQATEAEEEALGSLRDRWRPSDPGVFLGFESARSEALQAQRDVEDALQGLKEGSSAQARAGAIAFGQAVDVLGATWDSFHVKYDAFRGEALSSADVVSTLNTLVEDFQDVLSGARDLPDTESMRPVVQLLVMVAEEEAVALRRLRDTAQEVKPRPGEDGEAFFLEPDPALFEAFGGQVVRSATQRRQAKELLADILAQASQETNDAAQKFEVDFQALKSNSQSFHDEYQDWRRKEGGCVRPEAVRTLAGFVVRFAALGATVRALDPLVQARPLAELLVEAAEREEQAMRRLRDAWAPFDAEVYSLYDRKRSEASRLRRQVASGLSALLTEYGLSPGDTQ